MAGASTAPNKAKPKKGKQMAFTSSDMEIAWTALLVSLAETEWVDVVSTSTGEYYRLLVTNGSLRHWNRGTGAWDSTSPVPANLIAVTVRIG